jgi:hypothetical protein
MDEKRMTSSPGVATERPTEQAMKCAVELEVCVALSTSTVGMARVIDNHYPRSPDSKLEAYRKALEEARPAIDNLTNHQEQCDMDGCYVKVSRQAVDEVLGAIALARKALAAGG